MTRPDLQIVWQLSERFYASVESTGRGFHIANLPGRRLKKIRSTNVSCKHEISCDNTHRFIRCSTIRYQVAQVLWGVSGSVPCPDRDVAYVKFITIFQKLIGVVAVEEPLISPVTTSFVRSVYLNSSLCELT